nr:hypothetical protein [Tanacetum cinerariifolium]
MVLTKKVKKTPYEVWHGQAPNLSYLKSSLISKEASGSFKDLEEIQNEDTHPSENTSEHHDEDKQEIIKPQSDVIPNHRSESDKWLEAMNVEMKSIKNNKSSLISKEASGSFEDLEEIQNEDTHPSENTSEHHDEDKQEIIEPQSDVIPNHRSNPIEEKLILSKSQGTSPPDELKLVQTVPYASIVGSIMYVVRCTRPDVAFAQNLKSGFQQNPCKLHLTIVKNILKYLRNTKYMFLVYGGNIKWELRVT